ncbi:exported protein of unknown function [uncultured Woeseiaceae bacterium]|uniref:Uncharacterized protein n=1 Tax=uncultured Woeseiaceae bacterium TaxID=1983305 RepID=A0A7D9H398_9GAMM|nr:exported protein of unknown function [uncultured Woeseiaceae bacterium]
MKYSNVVRIFFLCTLAITLSGCPQPNNGSPSSSESLASSYSANDFVGLWKVTEICPQPTGTGELKFHFELNHGASSHAHVQVDSYYAIYPKGTFGGQTYYGLLISEEFANYNGPGKGDLINWNTTRLYFSPGDGSAQAGDPCALPSGTVAQIKTTPTGIVAPEFRPILHPPNRDHAIEIWLYEDADGNVSPVINFNHTTGVFSLHRGLIH